MQVLIGRWGNMTQLRSTIVYIQSEKLSIAQKPITEALEKGTSKIVLSKFYIDLKVNQKILISGEVDEWPGVIRTEIHTIKQVALVDKYTEIITEKGLENSFVRDSVRINANVALATHGETVSEVLGSGDARMSFQKFELKRNFRVTHVSTHVSLREACERVKKDRVLRVIDLTWDALQNFGVSRPRIGVAGLNPHCGEGGMFGREDDEEVLPAVESARRKGYGVEGPIPADTVFSKMKGGMYDAVVVMYHDQGHIPMKFLGFQYDEKTGQWGEMSGVNVTLGLPIVRTSVDHGTAFGKAGEGRANPQSMIEAIQLGAMLAKKS